MKFSKCLIVTLALSFVTSAWAKPEVKTKVSSKTRSRRGDTESTQGYIIKQTNKGLIKIPRKQSFKFGGSDVEGQAQSPSQTVFGKRPTPQRASLIPERTSFKREILDTAGSP